MSHLWLAVLCLVLMAAFIIAEYREKWTAGVALKGAASLCFVILGILGSRGAAFFLVSDIILILNTFGGDPQFKRRMLNLMLYYIGQILIALSLFLG